MQSFVCTGCGYNAVDNIPVRCPFCYADSDKFLKSEQTPHLYNISMVKVTDSVSQLITQPGIGTRAYRLETTDGPVWIDCPSVFDNKLEPVDAILYSHGDFMGASDLYRDYWAAETYLHEADCSHPLAVDHQVDHAFRGDFKRGSLEAWHLAGHTPGFTAYIDDDALFICDYIFGFGPDMKLNVFGNPDEIRAGILRLLDVIGERQLSVVCGYNYVTNYPQWRQHLLNLLGR